MVYLHNGVLFSYKKEMKFFISFQHLFIFERQRETEHEQGRGRERGRHTESKAGSRPETVNTEPDAGFKLTN